MFLNFSKKMFSDDSILQFLFLFQITKSKMPFRGVREIKVTGPKPEKNFTSTKLETKPDDNTLSAVRQTAKFFAETTTAHGYFHIAHSKYFFIKLLWIAILIGAHIFLIFQIYPLVKQYLARPISTKIYMKQHGKQKFPAVVVCNHNMIKKDKVQSILDEIKKFYKKENLTISNEEAFDDYIAEIADSGVNIFDFGHRKEDMIYSCKWIGKDCNDEDWDRFWHWKYGSCFVYNSGMHRNGTLKNITEVSKTGPNSALELNLFLDQRQYNTFLTETAGIRLHIGQQGKFYEPFNNGFSLSPGFGYSIGIKKRKIKRKDPFNNKTCITHSKLSLPNEVAQNHFTKYSTALCQSLCLSELLLKTCNCSQFYLPSLQNNTNICHSDKVECAYEQEELFAIGKINCLSPCNPACEETIFDRDVSFSQYPILSSVKTGDEDVWKEYVKLSIYYKTLDEEIWEDKIYYKIENLLADIGGQLGLLSGWSVLTTLEFIAFFGLVSGFFMKKFISISTNQGQVYNVS